MVAGILALLIKALFLIICLLVSCLFIILDVQAPGKKSIHGEFILVSSIHFLKDYLCVVLSNRFHRE